MISLDTVCFCHTLSPIKYIRLRRNFGQTAALDAGIKAAGNGRGPAKLSQMTYPACSSTWKKMAMMLYPGGEKTSGTA